MKKIRPNVSLACVLDFSPLVIPQRAEDITLISSSCCEWLKSQTACPSAKTPEAAFGRIGGPSAPLASREESSTAETAPRGPAGSLGPAPCVLGWMWPGHQGSLRAREAGDRGLLVCVGAGPYLSPAGLLEKWLESEAKCHIARPLKSGLTGRENDCQSVSCSQSAPGP